MLRSGSDNRDQKTQPLAPANVARKLTAHDIALGIGRRATNEEIEEYLDRPHGKSIPLKEAISQIKSKLQKKHDAKI
jgi:hypothetical protein